MNKVILMGNLTRDPEIRYSQGENSLAIARFSIAVNRRFSRQGDTDTDFFNCTAFGKQAEFVEKYFKQGSRMLLTGRVQNDNYTNKNGERVYSVQIMAMRLSLPRERVQQMQMHPRSAPILAVELRNRLWLQMTIS